MRAPGRTVTKPGARASVVQVFRPLGLTGAADRLSRKDARMDMVISFPGGARVDAEFGPYTVRTDQPQSGGGDGSAPAPFGVFLASIGTCAGIYVLGFCKQRGLPTDGIRIVQRVEGNAAKPGMVGKISLDIQVPPTFPEKYHDALIRAADQCAVKKHLESPPVFEVKTAVM
jgi:putative redox protein